MFIFLFWMWHWHSVEMPPQAFSKKTPVVTTMQNYDTHITFSWPSWMVWLMSEKVAPPQTTLEVAPKPFVAQQPQIADLSLIFITRARSQSVSLCHSKDSVDLHLKRTDVNVVEVWLASGCQTCIGWLDTLVTDMHKSGRASSVSPNGLHRFIVRINPKVYGEYLTSQGVKF
jgi:hypothetical protein